MRAVILMTVLGALWLPSAAAATASCAYESGANPKRVVVTLPADGDVATLHVTTGGEIALNSAACEDASGVPADVGNIDSILIQDTSAGGSARVNLHDIGEYVPGDTPEPLSLQSEIEFDVELGEGGGDELNVEGSQSSADNISVGAGGLNASPHQDDTDADLAYAGADSIGVYTTVGDDRIDARGGRGTGGPTEVPVALVGGVGSDVIYDGNGDDQLDGGWDTDYLAAVHGDDVVEGGNGSDELSYSAAPAGVTIDLRQPGPYATGGAGTDRVERVERLVGSQYADRLGLNSDGLIAAGPGDDVVTGSPFDDILSGDEGADRIDPGAGKDSIQGGDGTDLLSYASVGGPVEVRLGDFVQDTGAGGVDTQSQFEDLEGTAFADTLWGDNGANVITPGAGADVVRALDGADRLLVRDGEADNAACGGGDDAIAADAAALDTLSGDCETVDLPPLAEPPDTAVELRVSAKRVQRAVLSRGVVVEATCPAEPCAVRAAAGAKATTRELAAGRPAKLRVRLARNVRRALGRKIRAGKRPRIRVTVTATDAAGNVALKRRWVRAR